VARPRSSSRCWRFPFVLLSFAILETTVSFTAQQVLSNAADQISREIRTGQLTLSNTTKQEFRDKICSEISVIVGSACSGLLWDLNTYPTFADVPKKIPRSPDGDIDSTNFGYEPGDESAIVSLRIFYRWPALTDVMQPTMANLPERRRRCSTPPSHGKTSHSRRRHEPGYDPRKGTGKALPRATGAASRRSSSRWSFR
jgi:Flp pilus assembly protein TadG